MTTGLLVSQMPLLHIFAAIKISSVKVRTLANMWRMKARAAAVGYSSADRVMS